MMSIKRKLFAFYVLLSSASICRAATMPVEDLLNRVGGQGTSTRIVTEIAPSAAGNDYFTITSKGQKPKILGNSYLSVAAGIHWYLKYYANVCLTWNNLTTDLSGVDLPTPKSAERREATVKYRYYLNYCTYSYSMPFWDWERWQKEIDWMALHGINMPLALTGTETVWRNVLVNRLGYTPTEANRFIAGSGFQAWFLMNNLEGWGGPNPDSWYARQEALQKRVVARMRELGMEPVLPGYSGMMPHDIGAKKGWSIADPGKWCSFQRPGFLLPTDAHFGEMAGYYYDEMRALYGTSRYYSMDPFHEGGNTSGVNMSAAFRAVYDAMVSRSGHPSPQWVIQSWQENPRREALDALAPGTLVVLDLFSDGSKKWGGSYAQSGGSKHEFVYCMLHNFGGRTGLHGRLQRTIADFYAAKEQHPLTMLGVGATMEGIETNPVLYEALYELPWRTAELSAADWIAGYAKVRYGKQSDAAAQAWGLLLRSVYDCKTAQQGASESALCARPSLPVRSVSTWSTADIYWDVNDVHNAAALLLGESSRLSGANYEYDVVDVVRQVLSDYGHGLLTRITAAHKAGEAALRDTLAGRFLDIILQQDRLMNTMPDFMVGRWIKDARALGSTGEEKDLYEKNARLLITTWGGESQANAGGLHDYSNRQWGGLLKDFYYPRWTLFFERLKEGKETPSPKEFFDMEYAWATTPTTTSPYPHTAQGNPIAVAKEIFERYCKMIAS